MKKIETNGLFNFELLENSNEWYEDPDYREEIVAREIHSGAVLRRYPGAMKEMPDGQKWLFV